jgi:PAS domain S-box-containing protein
MSDNGTRVLIVDDDQNLLSSMSDILEFKGFSILGVNKANEVLGLLKHNAIEVALVDLRLQDMSGIELIQSIKKQSPYTECILLTGYASQSSAIEAIQSGAYGYFQKPFDIDQVVLSIQQASEKYKSAFALSSNEKRLSSLIENGRDHIVLLSPDGKPLWTSPSIQSYWGYSKDENFDYWTSDTIHPDDKARIAEKFQEVANTEKYKQNFSFRLKPKNGDWRWVEGNAVNAVDDPAVNAIVVNFRDVTEQKIIEDRLRLHDLALLTAANAVVITDREGLIQWVNPAFELLTGYVFEEIKGKNPRFLFSGAQSKQFYEILWQTILSGNAWHGELLNKRKNGSQYNEEMTITPLCGADGQVEHFIAIKQDISQRKEYERNLEISEFRYRSLFEASPVAILEEDFSEVQRVITQLKKRGVKDWQKYFTSHPDLVKMLVASVRINNVNIAAVHFHGAKTKEDLLDNLGRFFPTEILPHFINELSNFAEGKTNFHIETVNKAFDGRIVQIIIYWSVAPGYEKDLSKVIVSIVDITDLKRIELELKRKNELQEKVVVLGHELASSLELRTIYQTAEKHLKSMLNYDNFAIILFDPIKKLMIPEYVSSEGKTIDIKDLPPLKYDVKTATAGRAKAIATRNVVIESDVELKRKANWGMLVGSPQEPQTAIYIPMIAEQRVIGLLDLQSYSVDAFSDEVSEWLSVVSNQIGLAIQNARLHHEVITELSERKKAEKQIQRNLEELELLYENALAVNQLLDPKNIVDSTIKTFSKYFPMHNALIILKGEGKDTLTMAGAFGPGLKKNKHMEYQWIQKEKTIEIGQGISGWVMRMGEPLRVAEVTKNPNYIASAPNIKSGLYVPIKIGHYVLGSIAIESETPDAYTERDERLLVTIASQTAIALENASLYQKVQKELADRKIAEKALLESQGRLQSILDNTSALVYIKDLQGRYLLVNNALASIVGKHPNDLIGKLPNELLPYPEAVIHDENDRLVFEKGIPITFEENHTLKGVTNTFLSVKFPIRNEHGRIIALCGISSDITESKTAEEQLRLLSYAVEQSPASVIIMNKKGEIEYVNKKFTQLSGYTLDEVLGKTQKFLDTGSKNKEELATLWQTVLSGFEWQGEFYNRKKNGHFFWESSKISPVFDANHVIQHIMEIREDITARKDAELVLKKLNNELEDRVKQRTEELHLANLSLAKASRLKDEFLANMSHELRTPLTGVLGLSEALQKGVYGEINEKQATILSTIEEGGKHLLNLINDILDLSKIEAGKMDLQPNVIYVDDVCQSSLRMVKQIATAKHQNISLSVNPSNMAMFADPRRIKQILVNLLGNAVKFTPEYGELGLEVIGNDQDDLVTFTVWDRGIGISEADIEKLFQPFIQLDSSLSRSYAGTGLGLSLAQRLAFVHGGEIKVTSKVNEGSRFSVSIPWQKTRTLTLLQSSDLRKQSGSNNQQNIELPSSSKLILLVEDNLINSEMLADFLRFNGFRVIPAYDGKKGIELLTTMQPNLVLMDIQMPGISGLEAITTIRSMHGNISKVPIFALTALAMPEDKQLCLEAGANEYLSKPLNLNELITLINKYIVRQK